MLTKLFLLSSIILLNLFSFLAFAQEEGGYLLMPEVEDKEGVQESVGNVTSGEKGGDVWDRYNSEASGQDLSGQMASGIMTWDTLIDYTVYLVKVLSQLGLVVGAVMIIYAGYLYGVSVFTGDSTKGTGAVKDAVIGVVLVIFSYAIVKILTSMFL